MTTLFTEKSSRFSEYIKFEQKSLSTSIPKLSVLRVELERVQTGMSDFIIRVSTPSYDSVKSGTILSIRGNRTFTKFDTMLTLAKTISEEMQKRGDETHSWQEADMEHLADMIYGPLKYFASNTRIERLGFTTEALA